MVTSSELEDLVAEIRAIPFHRLKAGNWDCVFEKLFRLFTAKDPQTIEFAIERIATAIWSEQSAGRRDLEGRYRVPEARLVAVLQLLEPREDFVDCLTNFVADVSAMNSNEGFRNTFLEWIDDHKARPEVVKRWPDTALACRIRLRGFGVDWETASSALVDFLKHPSLHVRASAAEALGELFRETDFETPTLTELLEMVRREEIEHPGIAGPFYGAVAYDLDRLPKDGQAFARGWMLSILKARKGPEPPLLDYHFNGIDFHAHDLFAGHPRDIRKLMEIGRFDIAVMAATEDRYLVEGLEAILIDLGNNADDEICRLASWHLAYHYRSLHEQGCRRGFVSQRVVSDGVEIFFNITRPDRRHPYSAIIYPPRGRDFTGVEAWHWLEKLLPKNIRGHLVPFDGELFQEQTPDGGMILDNHITYGWSSGAIGTLTGDVAQRQWRAVTIIWHGAEGSWTPEDYLSDRDQREVP